MKKEKKRGTLYSAPRVICILYALFLSVFSLDVFNEGYGFWESMLALLIHLTPVFIVIIVLTVSWRWEWIGAIGFNTLAVLYIIMAWRQVHWTSYLMISGPLVLIGVLFLFNWIRKPRPHTP